MRCGDKECKSGTKVKYHDLFAGSPGENTIMNRFRTMWRDLPLPWGDARADPKAAQAYNFNQLGGYFAERGDAGDPNSWGWRFAPSTYLDNMHSGNQRYVNDLRHLNMKAMSFI